MRMRHGAGATSSSLGFLPLIIRGSLPPAPLPETAILSFSNAADLLPASQRSPVITVTVPWEPVPLGQYYATKHVSLAALMGVHGDLLSTAEYGRSVLDAPPLELLLSPTLMQDRICGSTATPPLALRMRRSHIYQWRSDSRCFLPHWHMMPAPASAKTFSPSVASTPTSLTCRS